MISFVQYFFENYHENRDLIMAPSQITGMHNSLNDLPDELPYGFWVNKWGHWIDLSRERHARWAMEMVTSYNIWAKVNNKKEQAWGNPYEILFDNGFVRMVSTYDKQDVYWENQDKGFVPSQSQQKFFSAVAQKYGVNVIRTIPQ